MMQYADVISSIFTKIDVWSCFWWLSTLIKFVLKSRLLYYRFQLRSKPIWIRMNTILNYFSIAFLSFIDQILEYGFQILLIFQWSWQEILANFVLNQLVHKIKINWPNCFILTLNWEFLARLIQLKHDLFADVKQFQNRLKVNKVCHYSVGVMSSFSFTLFLS